MWERKILGLKEATAQWCNPESFSCLWINCAYSLFGTYRSGKERLLAHLGSWPESTENSFRSQMQEHG